MFSLISEPKEVLSVKEKKLSETNGNYSSLSKQLLIDRLSAYKTSMFFFLYAAKENKQIVLQFEADTGGN